MGARARPFRQGQVPVLTEGPKDRANEAGAPEAVPAPGRPVTGAAEAEEGTETRPVLTVRPAGATYPLVGRLPVAEDIGPPVTVVEGSAVGRGRQNIGPTATASFEAAVATAVAGALTGTETTGPER